MRRIEPPPSRASGGDFLAQPAPQIDLAPARCSWHWGGAGSERAWLTAISASPRKSRMAWLALDRGPTIFKQRWL